MDVIIVRAGQAGTHIAQALTQEKHNVTLVDLDRQRPDRAEEFLDVRTIVIVFAESDQIFVKN